MYEIDSILNLVLYVMCIKNTKLLESIIIFKITPGL